MKNFQNWKFSIHSQQQYAMKHAHAKNLVCSETYGGKWWKIKNMVVNEKWGVK